MIDIPKSRLDCSPQEFSAALQKLRQALEDHIAGEPGVPAPVGHDLLHALIERVQDTNPIVAARKPDRFLIRDYRLVDDPIEVRRAALQQQLDAAAVAARAALLSPARQQLLQIDANAALAVAESDRTPDQAAALEQLAAFSAKCAAISRAAAVGAVEIEQLTPETIGGWKLPVF